jgi:F0F1-type ATP synthase membrane subunit b/b'
MNEQEMLENMRAEAKQRNEELKKQASERLKRNAERNKANKRKGNLQDSTYSKSKEV